MSNHSRRGSRPTLGLFIAVVAAVLVAAGALAAPPDRYRIAQRVQRAQRAQPGRHRAGRRR